MNLERIEYLSKMLVGQFYSSQKCCPNCGGDGKVVKRKMFVTALRRCNNCLMLYRSPTDSKTESHRFYEKFYRQSFATLMPDSPTLEKMKSNRFKGTEKDYTGYISDIAALGIKPHAKVFDFGCAWGYGSWQIAQAGYQVTATEIGKDRAQYASDMLGVNMVSDPFKFATRGDVANSFDCFFSSHVIEHVPSPSEIFELARKLLKPDGIFLCHIPNGSDEFKAASEHWNKLWGHVHPNLIDDKFLEKSFFGQPMVFASRKNREEIENLELPLEGALKLSLRNYDMLFACRMTAK
jgi:2-polyprenyl-3-methyl-5-hydroxy-6-metoxy-1,4-benzoquinol methylase